MNEIEHSSVQILGFPEHGQAPYKAQIIGGCEVSQSPDGGVLLKFDCCPNDDMMPDLRLAIKFQPSLFLEIAASGIQQVNIHRYLNYN